MEIEISLCAHRCTSLFFVNSNFSKVEFSDTSSVPKTLFILFINYKLYPHPFQQVILSEHREPNFWEGER